MSVIYCHACDRFIDTDWDVDHEYDCRVDNGLEVEEDD